MENLNSADNLFVAEIALDAGGVVRATCIKGFFSC